MIPSSRKEARDQAIQFYYTGIPCKHGHIAERRTINSECQECRKLRDKKDIASGLRKAHTDKYNHSKKSAACQAKYEKTEKGKAVHSKSMERHVAKRLRLVRVNKRRAAKLQRTPSWADLCRISTIYLNCPAGYTIDHVIPLCGKLVSGLHVPENLQYLTGSENSSKSNKFIIE